MPQRILKPGIVTSRRYNRLSWPAQCLHDRLVTLVDDFARYDADGLTLARVVFPFGDHTGRPISEEEAEAWLQELVREGCVVVYQAEGKRCLQLNRWTERCRANHSRFPGPPQQDSALAEPRQQLPASDSPRQQLPASDSNSESEFAAIGGHGGVAGSCQQPPANAALPSRPVPSPTTTRPEDKKKRDGSAVHASRTQWAALSRQVKELEGRGPTLEPEERRELRKKRGALRELEANQAEGNF